MRLGSPLLHANLGIMMSVMVLKHRPRHLLCLPDQVCDHGHLLSIRPPKGLVGSTVPTDLPSCCPQPSIQILALVGVWE